MFSPDYQRRHSKDQSWCGVHRKEQGREGKLVCSLRPALTCLHLLWPAALSPSGTTWSGQRVNWRKRGIPHFVLLLFLFYGGVFTVNIMLSGPFIVKRTTLSKYTMAKTLTSHLIIWSGTLNDLLCVSLHDSPFGDNGFTIIFNSTWAHTYKIVTATLWRQIIQHGGFLGVGVMNQTVKN